MNFLAIAVFFILIIAFGGILGAVLIMNRHRKDAMTQLDVREKAIVKRTDSVTNEVSSSGAGTVDSGNSYLKTDYFADFQLSDGEIKRFKVNKKTFVTLHNDESGYLSYRGNRFVSFDKLNDSSFDSPDLTDFFTYSKKIGPILPFYCEAPSRHLTIPSDKPITCDYRETWTYIGNVVFDKEESFCVVENQGKFLEIICAKLPDRFEVHLTLEDGKRLTFQSAETELIDKVLRAFYINEDMSKLSGWTIE